MDEPWDLGKCRLVEINHGSPFLMSASERVCHLVLAHEMQRKARPGLALPLNVEVGGDDTWSCCSHLATMRMAEQRGSKALGPQWCFESLN